MREAGIVRMIAQDDEGRAHGCWAAMETRDTTDRLVKNLKILPRLLAIPQFLDQ